MKELGIIDKDHLHLRIVHEISDLINQSTGLNTILEKVVNKIGDSLNFDVVSIYLWNKSKKRLELISTRGLKVEPGHFISLKPKEGLTGLVFSTMRTLNVMPASEHPSYKYFSEIGEEEFESYLGVPIILHNKCAGVLVAQTKEKKLIQLKKHCFRLFLQG